MHTPPSYSLSSCSYPITQSIPFVYSDSTLGQGLNDKFLIVFKSHLAITILVRHLHPAVDVLLCGVVLDSHHRVSLNQQSRYLTFRQVSTLVLVELVEQSLGDLQSLLYFFGVVSGLVFD